MVELYVCPKCGGIDWEERVNGYSAYYALEDGKIIKYDEDWWGETEILCSNCGINIDVGEIIVDKDEIDKISNMNGEDRLIYIISQEAKGRQMIVDLPEDFIDEVIFYHKDNKEFMKKIEPYLIALNIKT